MISPNSRSAIARRWCSLSADEHGVATAFEGPDGLALASAFDDLLGRQEKIGLTVKAGDYAEVFQAAFADRLVRRRELPGAQLHIFGQLEARLTESDRVILGGLVETVWPPAPRIDPWLSRPMRHELGLDLPERRIGLSAHDFAQLLGHEDVILTHSAKVGGAPAVASRFLHRLEAVAGEERWKAAKAAGDKYVRYAGAIDQPAEVKPIEQPQPRPPRETRPTKLSVTAIEDWLRDPYTIYARHILKLDPLDPVDMPLSAADRGSAIHESLGEFTREYANALPDDAVRRVAPYRRKAFRAADGEAGSSRAVVAALPADRALVRRMGGRAPRRYRRYRRRDQGRNQDPARQCQDIHALRARRPDRTPHATAAYAILDYKTGQPPTGKQVRMGLSPQLTLEAAILREGGFDDIDAGASVGELAYVRLSGNNPPGEHKTLELKIKQSDTPQLPDDAADYARAQLEALIRRFENPEEPYRSLVLSMWTARYGDYDNLARVKEWSAAGGVALEEW